jgi:hypothetical protein
MQPARKWAAVVVAGIGALVVAIGVIVVLSGGGRSMNSTEPIHTTSSQAAVAPPPPQPVVESAGEVFGVTPTFESVGSFSEEEHPDGTVLRTLRLHARLEGLLLKVAVNSSYTAAGASSTIAVAKEQSEPASLQHFVSRSCVKLVMGNSAGEDDRYELSPVSTHLQQHGLDVSGTLLYPAILPGEYEWNCNDETYKLGTVVTPNLGHQESYTVFKVRPEGDDTILIVGAHDHVNYIEFQESGDLHEVCIVSPEGGTALRPAHVVVYRSWSSGGEPYVLAALTFPAETTRIEHDRFYPPTCNPSGEEGVSLASPG